MHTTCTYPERDRSSPCPHVALPEIHLNIILTVSVQVRGACECFVTMPVFTVGSYQQLAQPPCWRTTPCKLSATAYSIYSQVVPLFATRRRTMPWRLGPTSWKKNTLYNLSYVYNEDTGFDYRHRKFLSSPNQADRLWGPPSL